MGLDRPALLALLSGLAGMAAAVAAGVFGSPVLGVMAGLAALAAGALPLSLVSRLHQAEERLRRLDGGAEPGPARPPAPLVDSVTGLPDEWYFHLVLEGRLAAARRQLQPLAVVLLEVSLEERDLLPAETMASFAGLLRQILRDSDTACRLGPSTFALLLERTSEEGGAAAAQRIQLALVRGGGSIRKLVAGVAAYPAHGLAADEVVRRARQALQRAAGEDSPLGLGGVELAQSD